MMELNRLLQTLKNMCQ